MSRAEIHRIGCVERIIGPQDPVDRRSFSSDDTRDDIRGLKLHVVHEVGDVVRAEHEGVEAMKQIGAVSRPGPARDLRGGSNRIDFGAEIQRSGLGRFDVRHYLSVRGIGSIEDKKERRKESPQEGLPLRIKMA